MVEVDYHFGGNIHLYSNKNHITKVNCHFPTCSDKRFGHPFPSPLFMLFSSASNKCGSCLDQGTHLLTKRWVGKNFIEVNNCPTTHDQEFPFPEPHLFQTLKFKLTEMNLFLT